jgi:hypothetical protein
MKQIFSFLCIFIFLSYAYVLPGGIKTTIVLNKQNDTAFNSITDFLENDSLIFKDTEASKVYEFLRGKCNVFFCSEQGLKGAEINFKANKLPKTWIEKYFNLSKCDLKVNIFNIVILNKKTHNTITVPGIHFTIKKPQK